jgi:hypothetical protein
MKTIRVKCTFIIPVDVPDDYYNDDFTPEFDIEENHCPGTGIVGAALDKLIEEHNKSSTCWACSVGGKCEIV